MNQYLEIINEVIGNGAALLVLFLTAVLISIFIDLKKSWKSLE